MGSVQENTEGAREILPGLFQIKIPIPIRSLGSVFVYLLRSGTHTLLVDTGWDSEEAYLALKSGLQSIDLKISQLEKIVVSHLHPDHFGLSSRIKEEAKDSVVIMHRDDSLAMRDTAGKFDLFLIKLNAWVRTHGVPEKEARAMSDSSLPMLKFVPPAKPDVQVIGGEVIRVGDAWEMLVISTPGHTKGNICLYDRSGSKILFSGDHILPTITPNVSFSPLYEGDPLGDYMSSLEQMKTLEVSQILPSHEYIFTGLQKRIQWIQQHHRDRLAETMLVLGSGNHEPMSGFSIASKLHWYSGSWDDLGPWEHRAALMETLAHLEYLKRKGKVAGIIESEDNRQSALYSLIDAC